MLKHASRQTPIGLFSSYETAMDLASRMFRSCPMSEFGSCIEEMEVDPIKNQLDSDMYPWAVSIDVVDGNTEVDELHELFTEEKLNYNQGRIARAYVFAPTEEEAENRASELWDGRSGDLLHLTAFTIFNVSIDDTGEVCDVRKVEAVNYKALVEPQIKEHADKIEVRVPADSIDEALAIARAEYDKWIDEQILQED